MPHVVPSYLLAGKTGNISSSGISEGILFSCWLTTAMVNRALRSANESVGLAGATLLASLCVAPINRKI